MTLIGQPSRFAMSAKVLSPERVDVNHGNVAVLGREEVEVDRQNVQVDLESLPDMQAGIQALRSKVARQEEQIASMCRENDALLELRFRIEEFEVVNTNLKSEISRVNSSNAHFRAEHLSMIAEQTRLKSSCKRLTGENSRLRRLNSHLTTENKSVKSKNAELKEEVERLVSQAEADADAVENEQQMMKESQRQKLEAVNRRLHEAAMIVDGALSRLPKRGE